MPKVSRADREKIARTRLLRVLGTLTVANLRTLEQKISDAGPYDQRIDPHILNNVRQALVQEGIIAVTNRNNAPWFYASNTTPERREARLSELVPIYKAYADIGGRIGQTLEIATYRALATIPSADFSGRFRDLDDHDDGSMYKKEEPLQSLSKHPVP